MRRAWLIALAATLPLTALAQDQQSSPGIVIRDFSVTDSPCRYKHDGAVEEALQIARIVTNAAKSSPERQVATVELRNNAAKTITAYVLNYTFAHDGKTDYYDGHGADLVYEMAVLLAFRRHYAAGFLAITGFGTTTVQYVDAFPFGSFLSPGTYTGLFAKADTLVISDLSSVPSPLPCFWSASGCSA